MACFLVPTGVAIVITLIAIFGKNRVPANLRLNMLALMLWGGALMLAVEHWAHQEIVPYFPFLTRGMDEVLPEMAMVGIPMTLVIFAAWGIIVYASTKLGTPVHTKAGTM
jgi:hypothetical protein